MQRTHISQNNFDENNFGGFLILDFKVYFAATLVKKVFYWCKNIHKNQ